MPYHNSSKKMGKKAKKRPKKVKQSNQLKKR
jgi:hypothetical protein